MIYKKNNGGVKKTKSVSNAAKEKVRKEKVRKEKVRKGLLKPNKVEIAAAKIKKKIKKSNGR
tara:strand:+ start:103 stop:288 length:186 start_codon:yes stop_codon:yes gene_type:complete